ncbi:hypothetical protein RRG08_014899 [Elysia crispata]|uniref:Uncharacterized protein n=1 Tax=Elysia crispata TaxID=231223 RepID=A0AAE1DI34_9GAST|nr:hypothetical protein RRG08_014899 [Elysia crispata]
MITCLPETARQRTLQLYDSKLRMPYCTSCPKADVQGLSMLPRELVSGLNSRNTAIGRAIEYFVELADFATVARSVNPVAASTSYPHICRTRRLPGQNKQRLAEKGFIALNSTR